MRKNEIGWQSQQRFCECLLDKQYGRNYLILDFLSNPSLNLRNLLREILNARTQQVKVAAVGG
ncbi:hypothetical protein LAY57_10065 [Argonema antarcticum A004/B2]|nr:hypothetical protein [Argonema antarcticum A004/B2]